MARRTHTAANTIVDLRQRRRRTHAGWQACSRASEDRVPRLAIVEPVAKRALTPGTVAWAHVPYEEIDGYKLRPVVVSHVVGRDVVVFPATTTVQRHRYPTQYRELANLASAGLRQTTGVELTTITIDVIEILSIAGALAGADSVAVLGSRPGYEQVGGLSAAT